MVAGGYRLIMSPEAAEDLAAIHAFIESDSEGIAAAVAERILNGLKKPEDVSASTRLGSL